MVILTIGVIVADVVYVVQGETGEYDDHSEWSVGFYPTRAEADKACAVLNDMCKQLEVILVAAGSNHVAGAALIEQCRKLDRYFQRDYTGTEYSVYELEQLAPFEPITLALPDPGPFDFPR